MTRLRLLVEVAAAAWTRDEKEGVGRGGERRGELSRAWQGARDVFSNPKAFGCKAFLLYFIMGMTNVQKCDRVYVRVRLCLYLCVCEREGESEREV